MKFLRWLFQWFDPIVFINEPVIIPTILVDTNADKLLKIVLAAIETDPTPKDEIPDDVACAQSLSTIVNKLFPNFPIVDSTSVLDLQLFMDKRFKRILEPVKGCIIVSPRTATTYGHCGYFLDDFHIASNDSETGLFKNNYTWTSWLKEFKDRRGLHIYIYSVV